MDNNTPSFAERIAALKAAAETVMLEAQRMEAAARKFDTRRQQKASRLTRLLPTLSPPYHDLGHTVRLMPPAYVKPYVKRQKNDAADAEAICEAVTRPNMRFVPTKTPEQQSCLTLHRTRHLFIRQQTAIINSIRACLAEFGIVAPVGRKGVEQLLEVAANVDDIRLPEVARACVAALSAQLVALKTQILAFDRRIMAWHRSNETSKRLDVIPGVGPALATALVASIADPRAFRSGRSVPSGRSSLPTYLWKLVPKDAYDLRCSASRRISCSPRSCPLPVEPDMARISVRKQLQQLDLADTSH
jgi:hypothetical protein